MNKKQLITMWVGILLASLVWLWGTIWGTKELVLIIVVITAGLIVSFSNNNYKLIKELIETLRNIKEYVAVIPAWLIYLFKNKKNKKSKDEQRQIKA